MKQLLELKQDYLLESRFLAKQIKDEKSGYYVNDYVDDTKTKANGRQNVESVILMVEVSDRDGYHSNNYQKVWLNKDDIIALAEKIKEIDSITGVGVPGDDLPF
jgi:hypothetical protein